MWWVGAGLLVVGNVVIGAKREEDGQGKGKGDGEVLPLEREEGGREEDGERYRDEGDEVNEGRVVDDDVLELEREVSVDGKQGGGRK